MVLATTSATAISTKSAQTAPSASVYNNKPPPFRTCLKIGFQREIAAVLFEISRFEEFSNTP
jgi:hypothetical protein